MTQISSGSQPFLIQQPDTWLHFIGGYYRNSDLFLTESKEKGFQRRIPAQVARGMRFGDKIVFLRYGGKHSKTVYAFGEGTITRLTFEARIAAQLGQELAEKGQATYTPGSGEVIRECGTYLVAGVWKVNCEIDIPELVEAAFRIAQERGENEPLFVMLGGILSTVYEQPVFLSPAPQFTRGFIKAEPDSTYHYTGTPAKETNTILEVKNYRKAEKRTGKHRGYRVNSNNRGQLSLLA